MNSSDTESKAKEPQDPNEELPPTAEESAEAAPEEMEASAEAEETEIAEEEEELDPYTALEQDVMKWKELAMRTAADMENFRKRASREREESMRYANQSMLEELLPILDNFDMGMQAAGQEEGSMIYIGMDMVRKQLNEFLTNSGVKEIPAEKQPFDPNVHEAVSQEESVDVEEGTVIRVTRRGYMLRDRLLRPASVIVAKAPESDAK